MPRRGSGFPHQVVTCKYPARGAKQTSSSSNFIFLKVGSANNFVGSNVYISERRNYGYCISPACWNGEHSALWRRIYPCAGRSSCLEPAPVRIAGATGQGTGFLPAACAADAHSPRCHADLVRQKLAVSHWLPLATLRLAVPAAALRRCVQGLRPNSSRVGAVRRTISKVNQLPRKVASATTANFGHTPQDC